MPCPLLRSVGLSGAEKSSQTKTDVPGDKMRKKELCKQKVYLLLLKIDPTVKNKKSEENQMFLRDKSEGT